MDAAKVRREALEEAARLMDSGAYGFGKSPARAKAIRALIQAAPQPGAQGALAGRAGGEET